MSKNITVQNGEINYPAFPSPAILSNDSRSYFSFSENGMTYKAANNNHIIGCCLQIDGKMYSTETKKCDFGLLLEDNRFFLIELKGIDVGSACKQLLTTLDLLKKDENYKDYNFNYFCRIVAKKGTPAANTQRQKLEKILGATPKNKKFLSHVNLLEEKI